MSGRSIFFNGRRLPFLSAARSVGSLLLASAGREANLPRPDEPPYLFCGNGGCRDCNLLVDGYEDVPSCRLPPAPGMSLRTGEGAGEENALSRSLGSLELEEEAPLVSDVVVVGAGPAGRAAAEEARALGAEPVVLDARRDVGMGVHGCRPVSVRSGIVFWWENGRPRPVRARALILATGAFGRFPTVPGATLGGVLPADLLERYLALGQPPGRFLATEAFDIERVAGTIAVERVRLKSGAEVSVDLVFVRTGREPQLSLAKALGCRTVYDRVLGYERLAIEDSGATTVPGIFAAGDAARIGTETEAVESGARAARAGAAFLGKTS
ncbi:MAG: FAD-dependent oxidoreductase, partial [Vicinamibacteria bacterium]